MSKILVFLPNAVSHAIALRSSQVHLGRHAHNTIVLPDHRVSGVHALLQRIDSDWWIEDLGSTNGTWINSKRIQTSIVLPDDELRLGACLLRLLSGTDKPTRSPARRRADAIHEALTLPAADFDVTNLMPSGQ